MDKSKLLIVLDTSGSMYEGAKYSSAENIIKFINESISMNLVAFDSSSLYSWSDDITSLKKDIKKLPSQRYKGQAKLNDLLDFLKSKHENLPLKVLIISDWSISKKDKKNLESWLESEGEISIRIVQTETSQTEIDKDQSGIFFHSQNIYAAIRSWI